MFLIQLADHFTLCKSFMRHFCLLLSCIKNILLDLSVNGAHTESNKKSFGVINFTSVTIFDILKI